MSTYTFRRKLNRDDWVKVIGIGAGAGIGTAVAAAYVARIFLQRSPLRDPSHAPSSTPDPRVGGA